jgi:hypothetical protein
MLDNLRAYLMVFFRPTAAFGSLIDRGNWLFAVLAVVVVSMGFQFALMTQSLRGVVDEPSRAPVATDSVWGGSPDSDESDEEDIPAPRNPAVRSWVPLVAGWLFSFSLVDGFSTIVNLLVLYVPASIFTMTLLAYIGSFTVAIRRDFGPLMICTCAAWVASHLPGIALGLVLPNVLGLTPGFIWLVTTIYFGILMVIALRTVFRVGLGPAVGTVSLSWLSLLMSGFLFALLRPFLLLYLIPLGLAAFVALRSAHLSQQRFRRNLELATLNPSDFDAHLQLGLLYLQRRQTGEAVARFQKAIAIAPREPDANYQLGCIAREQGRYAEALAHFEIVVGQDDKFATSEIWREIGATYLGAGMTDEAREALEKFTNRRPFDPEGLYYLGEVFRTTGFPDRGRECYERVLEAVATMPPNRRAETRRWRDLARERLKAR